MFFSKKQALNAFERKKNASLTTPISDDQFTFDVLKHSKDLYIVICHHTPTSEYWKELSYADHIEETKKRLLEIAKKSFKDVEKENEIEKKFNEMINFLKNT